jgi:hypothetical protein
MTEQEAGQVTQAEFARLCSVSRKTVTKWKQRDLLVMAGELVDVAASRALLARYRRDGEPEPLAAAVSTPGKAAAAKRTAGRPGTTPVKMTVAEVIERLQRLDWQSEPDWSDVARLDRARQAARCVGWHVFQSELGPPVHWGGLQLRENDRAEVRECDIVDGYGYELDASAVILQCREWVSELFDRTGEPLLELHDEVQVVPALLPALARPIWQGQRRE